MKSQFVKRIMENPAFASGGEGEGLGEEGARRMTSAREENMVASMGMLRRVYGSAEGYVRGVCGLGDEEVGRLRRNLVVVGGGGEGRLGEKGKVEERVGSAL